MRGSIKNLASPVQSRAVACLGHCARHAPPTRRTADRRERDILHTEFFCDSEDVQRTLEDAQRTLREHSEDVPRRSEDVWMDERMNE